MQHLRLPTAFEDSPDTAIPARVTKRSPIRALGRVGKGLAAFVVGIIIGASTIMIAETVTPSGDEPPVIDQLRR
ncbi:MAG: hypothetical protein U1E62_11855 [Alsobacter sp.]